MRKGHSQDSAGRQERATVSAACFAEEKMRDIFKIGFQGFENKSEAFLRMSMKHSR